MPKYYHLKIGNMNKEQSFVLYPYTGGDTIYLQSNKRFIQANLRTGEAIINAKGCDYANIIKLAMNPLKCQLPEDIKTAIQSHLWHNEGKEGNLSGVCFFENKQLFSEPANLL